MERYKFLIVCPSWVGDMIMSQSLLKYLKELYPNCIIDVLAPKSSLSLHSLMPEVSEALLSDFKHKELNLKKRLRLGKSLQQKKYTHAIVLPNSWKSALVPYSAKIPTRRGWLGEQRYFLLNRTKKLNKKKYPLMIDRFNALASENFDKAPKYSHLYPKLIIPDRLKNSVLEFYKLNQYSKKIIAICPGAEFGPAKKWPPSYYAVFANYFIEKGYNLWILGGPNDTDTAQEILSTIIKKEAIHNFTGSTSLTEAIAILNHSIAVLTNDSGLMHAACALNKKTLVIYGSTSDQFTPPLSDKAKTINVNHLTCRPCFQRACPLKHTNCLNELNPNRVIEEFKNLLDVL